MALTDHEIAFAETIELVLDHPITLSSDSGSIRCCELEMSTVRHYYHDGSLSIDGTLSLTLGMVTSVIGWAPLRFPISGKDRSLLSSFQRFLIFSGLSHAATSSIHYSKPIGMCTSNIVLLDFFGEDVATELPKLFHTRICIPRHKFI